MWILCNEFWCRCSIYRSRRKLVSLYFSLASLLHIHSRIRDVSKRSSNRYCHILLWQIASVNYYLSSVLCLKPVIWNRLHFGGKELHYLWSLLSEYNNRLVYRKAHWRKRLDKNVHNCWRKDWRWGELRIPNGYSSPKWTVWWHKPFRHLLADHSDEFLL